MPRIEVESIPCAYCLKYVDVRFVFEDSQYKGIDRSSDYVLVADCVFHSTCWDKQIKEHPP